MPQSRTPTGPPTILPDLGRFLRETDPGFKDFTEKDDWELGRFLVETEPEFRDVVSYEGTAEALVGPLGRVNLQGPTPLPTGPAREVVAKQRTRIAEQTRAQELPPPRRPVIPEKDRTFSAGEKLLYSGRGPLNLPGEVLRGVTRGAAGVAQGFLGGVEPLTSATGDKSVPMAIGALDRYFESAAENDARLGIEPWKSPEWWAQKVGEVGGSVAGLAWAGGPFRAAGLEAFSEAGNAAIVNEKRYQLGEITKGQQLFDTVTTFLINAAVLGGTNAKLFEAALAAGPTYARVIKGAVSEGVLQETVQQLTSNVMTGKTSTDPNAVNARGESLYLFDGVPESLVVGAGAGAAFAGMRGPEAIREGVRPLVPPSPWSRVLRERAGLKQTSTPSQPPGPAPTAPAPPGAPPVVGKDYPAPPTPAAQGNLPYAAQQAPTLFGQPGTLGDQPVLGVDALANAEGAIRAGVAPGTRPAVLPEPTLVRGGLPQPVEAAPPPTLVFPPAGDLTTVTPEAAAAHRQATEQALQALPVELQAQARRMLDEGFVPQSVAPDGSIWATDTRPGREGKVAVFRPDPEPDQGITLRHLSVAERLGLGNLHAALSMLANGENPLETDLAPIQLLNQLGVLAPGETLLQGFSDYVEAIESLLLSDEASPQSDQAIALLRNWAVGSVPVVDPQLLGQTLPEMAAEVNLLQNTVAALPGDRLPGIQNRWQQAIAAMAPLPSQDVMIPWEGKKRRKTLAGVKLEEAQAIRANQPLSPTEKKDQLRRLMGLHTPAERATRMQEHRAKTKARLQRAAFELQPFGYEHPILRKERETMERAAETDPELNPHLYILRAVAERGGIHDVPKGEEGYEERSWMGEFAGGGGRVAGYKVLSRVGSKAERSRLKQAGNLRTLESIHHELEQADPYFETMDYSEFERKFIDALSWAANKGMSQRRMPRSRRRGRKGLGITEVGAAPPEVTEVTTEAVEPGPAPAPDRRLRINRGMHTPIEVIFPDSAHKELFVEASRWRRATREGTPYTPNTARLAKLFDIDEAQVIGRAVDYRQQVIDQAKTLPAQGEGLTLTAPRVSFAGAEPSVEKMRVGPSRKGSEPGQGKIRGGGASERGWRAMSRALYQGDPAEVATRELAQNAIDEATSAHPDGSGEVTIRAHEGTYNVDTYDPTAPEAGTYVEVSDNGRGMALEQVETVFSNLFESGKEEDVEASGGFGVAKAAILMGGVYMRMSTVVDEAKGRWGKVRVRHTWEGTPDDIRSDRGAVDYTEIVAAGTPTGTSVRVYFPNQKFYTLKRAGEKALVNHQVYSRRIGATLHSVQSERILEWDDQRQESVEIVRETSRKTIPSEETDRLRPLGQLDTSFGRVSFYEATRKPELWGSGVEDSPRASRRSISVVYLNNHRYALSGGSVYLAGEIPNLPGVVVADLEPGGIAESDEHYPFTIARDNIKTELAATIETWIKANVVTPEANKWSTQLADAFDNIPSRGFGGEIIDIYNVRNRYTDQEIDDLFLDSPTMTRLAPVIVKVIHKMGRTLHPAEDAKTTKAGLLLAAVGFGGVNLTPKGKNGQTAILINPFAVIQILREENLPLRNDHVAFGLAHLILHEVTHHKAKSGKDDAAFTFQFFNNQTRYGPAFTDDVATILAALRGVSHAQAAATLKSGQLDLFGEPAAEAPGAAARPGDDHISDDLLGGYARHRQILTRDGQNDPLVVEENRLERPADGAESTGGVRESARDVGGEARAGETAGESAGESREARAGESPSESGVTPDPDAPIGSPERTEFAKQEISRILRSFISEAGAFNLEKAPALVKEITVYGAGLLARGVRNFPTWAKRMRQAFPYLRRVQIEAVWYALRRSGDDPARAAKVLQQATTPRERAALPQARKREVGMPPPSLANRAVTIGKRTTQNLVASMTEFGDLVQEILDLVDWSRIVRIVGNTDTRFRVFRQIATQILARPEFDPIVVEAGLATRQQLADHFVQLVSLQGLSLGRIGRAVQGNAKSIVLLDRAAARGITAERIQAGTLIPEGAIVSGDEILLPDGRRINKRMADKADSAFKDLLDSLVDPDTVSSNFGALADAVYHAFGSYLAQLGMEGTTDPLWDVLKETYDVSERVAGEAAIRKKAGSFLQDAHILGVAGMLSHLATAMRNLYTSGIRIPFQLVFSEGVAAAYAESRALIARDSARKALWARTAHAHGSLARKGVALLFNASVLRNNPFPQRAWGDQLEEIYGLKQYLKEHPNDHSTRRSLYLLKGFPGRAANFLQYTMGAEDVDVGRIHAPMHRWMRRLQFFTRQQEFAVRGLIFDAAVRAEFARRGLSFADFTREIEEAQGAAEARGDREAAISPLHAQIIERYFGSEGGLQTLDDILAIAVGKALDLTFAGEGIPGGAVSNLLKVYQADAMLLVRMVSPFMRFVLNAGGHLYDQTLAGIEPILYWPQEKMTTALNVAQLRTAMKLERKAAAEEGRAPRSEEEVAENLPTRRPIGRYAKASQSQTLEKGIPDARARLDEYRMRLARQMAALRQAKIALRQAKAAQAKAQRAAAGPTPDFLTPSVQTTIPSTQFEEQQVAELEAEVARLKQTTRMLVNRLKKWTTQLERIHSAGISRDTAEFYGRVAMGGAMLSIALALVYLLQPDDEGREWYELQLPDPEGKPEWMKVTDLRSFAPYVSFLFMATMIKSFHRKTNWEQFWKDYDRLRQEYDARLPPLPDTPAGKVAAILEAPVHGFEKNRQALIQAFQMNYGGKYRAGKAWKESVEALIGISRQTGTQSFIMDIFFGGRPPEGGGEQLFHGLIGMAASFASRYTKPFGMLTDLQMIWDEEARIRRTAPRQPLNIPGGWTAPFQQILENIPGVREKIFESISPFTGKPREVETPILRQFTGFTIKEIAPVEREFRRLGMTPQEWGVKQTEIPWVDNHVAAHYHTLLTDVFLEQILPSDFYQGLSQNERRQFLTGTRTQSADRPGASITIPGILGDLKRVALYRATNDLAAERDVQRATTSARQAADFERWGRALVGLEAWTKMMHGEGMMSDEDEEETGEVIRPGPSSLVGVPPPSIQ